MRPLFAAVVGATLLVVTSPSDPAAASHARPAVRASAISTPIQHVVVIMQENRSFDNYFGTYPGATGIPSGVCVPDPTNGGCIAPYHNPADLNLDSPHGSGDSVADVDAGRMDGFVKQAERYCACGTTDVMGYHDNREIPNYWLYAGRYTLQDHMFSSAASWSLPNHFYLVSGWSANCPTLDPMSCVGTVNMTQAQEKFDFPWADLTYLLHRNAVSWKYYVAEGTSPDCDGMTPNACATTVQNPGTPSIWNPLPYFETVKSDGELGNVQELSDLKEDLAAGTLPSVSWVVPNGNQSEHSPAGLMSAGQQFTSSVIDAIMASPAWASTAIFISWDEWGGLYDNVVPPVVDKFGLGLRVPGLLISPWARPGYIDHQVLTFDNYNRLIEDLFLGGQRLDPATDGLPDPRPDVRENAAVLGDLLNEFDFTQQPLPPLFIPQLALPYSSSAPGRIQRITGSHYTPGETVTLRWDCLNPACAGATVATLTADASGNLPSTPITMPAGPSGYHTIGGVGSSGDFGEINTHFP